MSVIILIFSGQNPCTRIISNILHSFLDFSRALKKILVLWNNSKEKVRMGAGENKLQMLQISLNEILCMMILPVFSQFPGNLKSICSCPHKKLSLVLLQITYCIYSP